MQTISSVKATEFTPNFVPKPSLCLSCKKNDIEEWDDEKLCCKDFDAQEDPAGFFCNSYEPMW